MEEIICGGGDDGIFGGKIVWTPTMRYDAVEGKTIPSFRHPNRSTEGSLR